MTGASRAWVAPGILRLHIGLLTRLQALADAFPDREFEIVSAHRPNARPTSRHRSGRALDLRIDGIHRRRVAAFARNLAKTGVGYYPNSTFTHVDVRADATHWVDRSGPGERPDYGVWPDRDAERDLERTVLAQVETATRALADGFSNLTPPSRRLPTAVPLPRAAPPPRIASGPARDRDVDWSIPW